MVPTLFFETCGLNKFMNATLTHYRLRPLIPAVLMALLGACSSNPQPQLKQDDLPTQWQGPAATQASIWPQLDWWKAFNDPELVSLIENVRTDNLDLAINRRQLAMAQLNLRDANLNLLPTPALELGYNNRYSDTLSDGTNGQTSRDYNLELSLNYSDILKKPSEHKLASAQYDASEAHAIDSVLSTYRTAASTYFQILLIRDKLRTAEQNLQNGEQLLRIIQAKVDAGTTTELDALQQKLEVEKQRNNIRSLKQSELTTQGSLALLTGQRLYQFNVRSESLVALEVPTVQPGLPSELLSRRPDLVQAEADLRAANVNLELARLSYLPSIALNASAKVASDSLQAFLESPLKPVSASINATQLLLDNGARQRNNKRSQLALENSLDSYRKAVLTAFNDVEISLSNLSMLDAEARVYAQEEDRAQEAFRIAKVRYVQGVADYQTLLNTQNNLYSVRISSLENKLQRLNALVNFYVALGGGWQKDDETLTQHTLASSRKYESSVKKPEGH